MFTFYFIWRGMGSGITRFSTSIWKLACIYGSFQIILFVWLWGHRAFVYNWEEQTNKWWNSRHKKPIWHIWYGYDQRWYTNQDMMIPCDLNQPLTYIVAWKIVADTNMESKITIALNMKNIERIVKSLNIQWEKVL